MPRQRRFRLRLIARDEIETLSEVNWQPECGSSGDAPWPSRPIDPLNGGAMNQSDGVTGKACTTICDTSMPCHTDMNVNSTTVVVTHTFGESLIKTRNVNICCGLFEFHVVDPGVNDR